MANGLYPYILNDLKLLTQDAYTGHKIDYAGFTDMLLMNTMNKPVPLNTPEGHKREMRAWYRQRPTVAMTDTAKSCDNVLTPARKETTMSVSNTRQIAYHINDELIATYNQEASQNVGLGGQFGASREMMDILFSAGNAIKKAVNADLLALVSFGRNRVSGASTAQTINFPQTVTTQPLNNGITKVLYDYKANNLTGRPQLVGSGFAFQWALQQPYKAPDTGGIDTRLAFTNFDFWFDQDYADVFTGGTGNEFGVFEPGAAHIVEYNEYTGFKAGVKPGASEFFNVKLPTMDPNGNIIPFSVDVQMKYSDCSATFTDAYSGGSVTLEKGWNMIVSKQFGFWQIPSDAFRNEDPQIAVNGALRYVATNS